MPREELRKKITVEMKHMISKLSYRELQKIAKEKGIRANQKSSVLKAWLTKAMIEAELIRRMEESQAGEKDPEEDADFEDRNPNMVI